MEYCARMSLLFHRRQVWLPTVWGWLLLLGSAVVLLVALAFGVTDFLTVREPARGADGHGARTLVVEGWLEAADLDQAIAAFASGHYDRVLTTGGPIDAWDGAPLWHSFAERAADYLKAHGLRGVAVIAVPAPASAQNRTFLSAVMVREWARHAGIALGAIDLYSAGVHARRSRLLYRLAFGPAVEVGVLAAAPRGYDMQRWWTSSAATKTVLGEALSWLWTECCFWPPAPGSHEERWAVPTASH